jgi:plastocyanin
MNHGHRRLASLTTLVAALVLVTGLAVGAGPRVTSAHEGAAHPAHIHSGTCEELGGVVAPLSDVSDQFLSDGTPIASAERVGAESAIPVDASVTTVNLSLPDIIAGGHAINVHESAEDIGNYIACGAIGGVMLGDSDLPIGLAELNESGVSGVAWLHDNGDGTTTVYVFLTKKAAAEETGAEAVAVTIENFTFNPATIEIAVGTTVTWTNNDPAPHTTTQEPAGSGFQSGRLNTGDSFSHTFDTPGTYNYFCEFHPNMKGAVVVS